MKSISGKYFLFTILLIFFLLIFESFLQYLHDYREKKNQLQRTVTQMLDIVTDSAAQAAYNLDDKLAEKVTAGLIDHHYIARASIINDFGDTLAESISPEAGMPDFYLKGIEISEGNVISVPLKEETSGLHVGKIILHLNGRAITADLLRALLFSISYILFWDVILVTILTVFIYYWLVKPLTGITKKLVLLEIKSPFEQKIQIPRHHKNDEMGHLVITINSILSELSAHMELQEQNEEEIRMSLMEKEILLKEIHHRVKNNLQIITSLLNLQANSIQDTQTQNVIRESQNRISAMALVHEELYSSENLSEINFRIYIQKLAYKLKDIYSQSPRIEYQFSIPDIYLNINTTIICGLIINELISNSFKYAFPKHRKGTIRLSMDITDDHAAIQISDNGVGLPDQTAGPARESLGLQLVYGLAEQLDGTLTVKSDHGASFTINFPLH
ncbi:MAG: sensor histidine kinase [Spirochaetia bacterium]